MMKIATWNLERPRISSTKNSHIVDALKKVDADILILTETNSCITPGSQYHHSQTLALTGSPSEKGEQYSEGENRVTIWSRYPIQESLATYDPHTTVCASLDTPLGKLSVYGTVIGIFGNRDNGFDTHLDKQIVDWHKLSSAGSFCIAGDFNTSFSDGYYYTKLGRQKIDDCFTELAIDLPTREIACNIDHIAISRAFLQSKRCSTTIWNEDKKLSDHIGVCLHVEHGQ